MDQEPAQKELVDRLVSALRQDEFVLYSQAIKPLAAGSGNRPFHEILIRYQEEETKLLPPGSFLPILEDCRLMPYVDRWVVGRITKWIRAAQAVKSDWEVPRNSINLSADTLDDPSFVEFARKQMQVAKLPEGALSFEITWANSNEQTELLRSMFALLKPAGCCFTIAGFDASDEAFGILKTLKPDFIKLGSSIIRNVARSTAEAAKVEAINKKCHSLGIKTIAEHVESNDVLERLRQAGVDFAQGLGISPPQPLT